MNLEEWKWVDLREKRDKCDVVWINGKMVTNKKKVCNELIDVNNKKLFFYLF